MVTKHNAVL